MALLHRGDFKLRVTVWHEEERRDSKTEDDNNTSSAVQDVLQKTFIKAERKCQSSFNDRDSALINPGVLDCWSQVASTPALISAQQQVLLFRK